MKIRFKVLRDLGSLPHGEIFIPFGEIDLCIIHDQGDGGLVERAVGPEFLRKILTGTIQWAKDGTK